MRLPDFLIIGAAKAGTTTLYEYLCRHPQVYMSVPKEPEFFAEDKYYDRGLDFYASLFEEAASGRICGEASTKYTISAWTAKSAERISKHLPQVKLIYIMRHPVERSYSHYVQEIKTYQNRGEKLVVTESFEQRLLTDDIILETSEYIAQINRYLQFFPKESFLFLTIEEIIKEPTQTLRKVCNFLNIDPDVDLIKNQVVKANQAIAHQEWFIRSRITAPLRENSVISHLASLLPQSTKDVAYSFLKQLPYTKEIENKSVPPKMLPETRKMLIERFHQPNRELANFLDIDISHWEV